MQHRTGYMLEEVRHGFILQQVNCQGVMGSGIAKAIRAKWPIVWEHYSDFCKRSPTGSLGLLGHFQIVPVETNLSIVNLFSQHGYGNGGKHTNYEAMACALAGFEHMRSAAAFIDPLMETHHPMIGCGLGGGDWAEVYKIITKHIKCETTVWTLPGEEFTTEYLVDR